MFIAAKEMYGTSLDGIDGHVGVLHDVLFDDRSWNVRHLVVGTDRWFHGRQVLLEPAVVERADWSARSIRVRLTKEQARQCPDVNTDLPVARRDAIEAPQVLVWEAYWTGVMSAASESVGDPHLRSTRMLAGLHLHCPDGQIGHVEDFIVDDETWSVRDLVVDTRNWWPGKRVLIETTAVESIDWEEREIHLAMSRDQIEHRPAYEGVVPSETPLASMA